MMINIHQCETEQSVAIAVFEKAILIQAFSRCDYTPAFRRVILNQEVKNVKGSVPQQLQLDDAAEFDATSWNTDHSDWLLSIQIADECCLHKRTE